MKINVLQSKDVLETEIVINCQTIDAEIEKVISAIRLIDNMIAGKINSEMFFIPASEIYYFETVDNKTFFYTKDIMYETQLKLYQVEEKLLGTTFIKTNKSTIANLKKVKSIKSEFNSRIIASLLNGEKIIISRQYMKCIKSKLGM